MGVRARDIIKNLVEDLPPRDDIARIPGTPVGRRYARMKGLRSMVAPYSRDLFVKLAANTVGLKATKGFPNRDAVGKVQRTF